MIEDSEQGGGAVLELRALDKTTPPPAKAIERPCWSDIEHAIGKAFAYGGFVHLSVLQPKMSFIDILDMQSLPGQFRLIVLTKSTDPKAQLLEWWELGDASFRGAIRFGDDDWDARTVCSDIAVAKKVFKDLFDHGELTDAGLSQFRSEWDRKPQ